MSTTPTNPRITRVDVQPTDDARYVSVRPYWDADGNLDRHDGIGMQVPRSVAPRLVRAIEAGAVFTSPVVLTDVDGRTYVHAERHVMAKYASADLKRLGF